MAGEALVAWLKRFVPAPMAMGHAERLRAGLGIAIGLGLTGLVCSLWTGNALSAPLLIAPMGASALVGVTAAQWLHPPLVAAAIAVMAAMLAMSALRCLHPPSGAIALIAVLGGPKILAGGYGFVLVPVLLNSLILTGAALVYNNLTGRSYPHHAHPPPAKPVLALTQEDLDAALSAYGETVDISRDDLEALFQDLVSRAERRA